MDRLERVLQDRAEKERKAALISLYGGLVKGVNRSGGLLTGLNIKWDGAGCLFVIKAQFPSGDFVAFAWADDLPAGFAKVMKEASADKLRWRRDRFNRKED